MRAVTKPYPPASVVGAIIISRLGIPPGRHALDIEAVGLVTSQLDRLPSRDEYKKVIRCDTYAVDCSDCLQWKLHVLDCCSLCEHNYVIRVN